jgi:hypothetical protein
MSAPSPCLPWWSPRNRGRLALLIHLLLLGVFAVAAIIAHMLRADRPDVWVTTQIQRWKGADGLLRAVSWFGSAPQAVVVGGDREQHRAEPAKLGKVILV